MTGGVKLEFAAANVTEAAMLATKRFREVMEDPEAELPWSTHFEFSEQMMPSPDIEGGEELVMMVAVRIEFDDRAQGHSKSLAG
jgi:hypothetical protein